MSELAKYGVYAGEGKVHEEMIYSLALIYSIVNNDITAFLKEHNLTPGKLNVLIAIKHHGGSKGLPQVEVSKHLIVTKSNTTKLLEKLEKEGLVTRMQQVDDKRVNITKITKKAENLLDSIWGEYNKKLKSLAGKLDSEKQRKLSSLLIDWFGELVG